MLEFLDNDPSSLKLFEELVLKGNVLTLEEFFSSKEEIRKKLLSLDYQPEAVDRIISFITFDKIKFEGKDLIFLNKKDKEMLLESFKELREEFESKNFGKFNDRLYEEAMFWDEFFKRQFEEKSFLYGNALDDSTIRNSLPSFIKKVLEELPKDKALDLDENLEDIRTNQINDKYIAVGNSDQVPLINSINNHSLAILYKNISALEISKKGFDPDEDFAEFKVVPQNINPNAKMAAPLDIRGDHSSNRKSLGLSDHKPQPPAHQMNPERQVRDEAQFRKDFQNVLQSVCRSINHKMNDGHLGNFFGTPESNDNIQFINSINTQIQKFEQSENFLRSKGSSFYDDDFMSKYKEFNERTRHLLVIFYSMFPISIATDREKVRNLYKTFEVLKGEMLKFKSELKAKMRPEEYEAHKYPIDFLFKLIHDGTSRLSGNV